MSQRVARGEGARNERRGAGRGAHATKNDELEARKPHCRGTGLFAVSFPQRSCVCGRSISRDARWAGAVLRQLTTTAVVHAGDAHPMTRPTRCMCI